MNTKNSYDSQMETKEFIQVTVSHCQDKEVSSQQVLRESLWKIMNDHSIFDKHKTAPEYGGLFQMINKAVIYLVQ